MLTAYSIYPDFNKHACELLQKEGIKIEFSHITQESTSEELEKIIQNYDVIILGIRQKLTKEMLNKITAPKIIATLSAGLDHIAPEYFENELITVVNCPTANVNSVAEHILGLILVLKRRILEGNRIVLQKGNRTQMSQRTEDISNSTIGFIGSGKITKAVINLLVGFHMNILCYTISENTEELLKMGVTFTDLDTLLQQSDIIVENVPLTDSTRNLIGKEQIAKMKQEVVFINTSRDKVADVKALIEEADKNPNFMVGMDIDTEDDQEILEKQRNNVIITPHIAGTSKQAIQRMELELAENIIKVVREK